MAGILRNIRFRTQTATILSVEHIPRVLIQWDLERSGQNLRNIVFFVDRGESPTELLPLSAQPIPATAPREFLDLTANLRDLHKIYYYRVRAVEMAGGKPQQTFESPVFTWNGDLDLVGLYVVEEHLFLYRWTKAGVPVMIFKKRHEGERCPDCWDAVLKRVTSSSCTTCLGTGYTQGYYPPIDGWAGFEPDPKVTQVADFGHAQPMQTDFRFTDYPGLRNDDIVFEVKLHRFWKVSQLSQAEANRAAMLQFARVDAVNPSDIETRLEIPEARRQALLGELECRRKETEF